MICHKHNYNNELILNLLFKKDGKLYTLSNSDFDDIYVYITDENRIEEKLYKLSNGDIIFNPLGFYVLKISNQVIRQLSGYIEIEISIHNSVKNTTLYTNKVIYIKPIRKPIKKYKYELD